MFSWSLLYLFFLIKIILQRPERKYPKEKSYPWSCHPSLFPSSLGPRAHWHTSQSFTRECAYNHVLFLSLNILCQHSSILFRWLAALILNHCTKVCWVPYTLLLFKCEKPRTPAVGYWSEQSLSCGKIPLCWNLNLLIYWRYLKGVQFSHLWHKCFFLIGCPFLVGGWGKGTCTWALAEVRCVCSRGRAGL